MHVSSDASSKCYDPSSLADLGGYGWTTTPSSLEPSALIGSKLDPINYIPRGDSHSFYEFSLLKNESIASNINFDVPSYVMSHLERSLGLPFILLGMMIGDLEAVDKFTITVDV